MCWLARRAIIPQNLGGDGTQYRVLRLSKTQMRGIVMDHVLFYHHTHQIRPIIGTLAPSIHAPTDYHFWLINHNFCTVAQSHAREQEQ